MSSFSSDQNKQKPTKIEDFNLQYFQLINQVQMFLKGEVVKKLETFAKCEKQNGKLLSEETSFLLKDFNEKHKILSKLIPNTFQANTGK